MCMRLCPVMRYHMISKNGLGQTYPLANATNTQTLTNDRGLDSSLLTEELVLRYSFLILNATNALQT